MKPHLKGAPSLAEGGGGAGGGGGWVGPEGADGGRVGGDSDMTAEMQVDLARLRAGQEQGTVGEIWMLTINTTSFGTVVGHTNKYPLASKLFPLLPGGEATLRLRVVLDRSIVEAFAQGGRSVITATSFAAASDNGAAAYVEGGDATLQNATAYAVGCAWKENINV